MAVVGFCVQVAGLSGAERTHRRVLAVLAYLRST
jgi:hypothetical protein